MKRLLLALTVFFLAMGTALAQRTITGTVTDDAGETLIGATVRVDGTNRGAVTDINGQYTIEVPNGATKLTFSYTGFETQTVTLGATNVQDLIMSGSTLLTETVVTALGFEVEKGKQGTATSTVDGEALVRSGEVGIINGLQGKSAGINIVSSSGDPGASSRIQIRGATSITGDLQPLIVIDGIPMFNDNFFGSAFGGNGSGSSGSLGSGGGVTQQSRMNDLNPNDILSMEVIRGASAAALWGSRAANGVIVITTKKGKSGRKGYTVNVGSSLGFTQPNKEVALQNTFGRGNGMQFQFNPTGGRSWGDVIAERPGGADNFNTSGEYFEAQDGTRFYPIDDGTLADPNGGKNSTETFDPYDMLFKTGTILNNNISVSNSHDNGSVYFSLANVDQDGMIRNNSTYNRTTATLNAVQSLGDKITIDGGLTYSISNSDRVQMGSNLNGLFLGGLRSAADFNDDVYAGTYVDDAGAVFTNRHRAYRNPLGANNNSIYDNPLWMMNNIESDNDVNRTISRLEVRYYPISNLTITARGGADTYVDERADYFPELSSGSNGGGRYSREVLNRKQYNMDLFGRYLFDVNDDIKVSTLLGTNYNQRKRNSFFSTIRGFTNPLAPPILSNTAQQPEQGNIYEERRLHGVYGNIGLEFFDQLFVNLTGRNDFTSTIVEGNAPDDVDNSFFYPAADFSWQFGKLLPKGGTVSSGRLRGGWGRVGREPGEYIDGPNVFYAPTAANTGFGEGWGPGINPASYGGAFAASSIARNPYIRPEIKTEFEAGLDFGLLKDRFTVGVTYYQNVTDDLIIQVATPPSTGFTNQITNAASIENQGVEVEFNLNPVKNRKLNWNIYGNFTHNRNEVTEMNGTESILLAGFAGTSSRAIVGEQLGVLFGGVWDRNTDGSLLLNDDGFPGLAAASGVIGDPNPDYRAGLGTSLSYGAFDLNILFDAAMGFELWNGTRGALTFFGRDQQSAVLTTLSESEANSLKTITGQTVAEAYGFRQNTDGSYTVRGSVNDFGGGNVFLDELWYRSGPGSGFTGPDEQFVEDASWTRLRELSLTYNFSAAKYGLKGFQGAQLTFIGRNLLLWTDYLGNDPDTSLNGPGNNGFGLDYFQHPNSRSYQVGLNLTF